MNWLHCFWAVGCTVSPLLFSQILTGGGSWQKSYISIGVIQAIIAALMVFALPLWGKVPLKLHENTGTLEKSDTEKNAENPTQNVVKFGTLIKIPHIKTALAAFFCYCAYEAAFGLWISSYMVSVRGLTATEASYHASAFYVGIAAGRFLSGIVSSRLKSAELMRIGCIIAGFGALILLLPGSGVFPFVGALSVGLGAAPFYPNLMFRAPRIFGKENSQSAIGVLMASAYIGLTLVPPVVGVIPLKVFPVCILVLIGASFFLSEILPKENAEKV
jgi:fucose permease